MTLRVLYSFPGRLGTTGVGTTAWYQVTGLIALGVRVTLFCGSCERPIEGADTIVETMRIMRMPLPYRLLGNDASYRFHDEKVARHLRSCHSEYDVVHTWPLGGLKTLRAARELEIPGFLERPNTHTEHAFTIVAEEHASLGLPVPKDNPHAFHQGRLKQELLEYDAAKYLLCPSEAVAKTFLERGFSLERIARHQYGYDAKRFRLPTSAVRPESANGRITAIFTGRCEPRKGLHYALQAWHESGACEQGRFIICGTFIPGYRELLQPYLGHPSIDYRGYTSDVPGVMQSADVLLLPAVEEGSALVTYEARGAGCIPLVSCAAGAVGQDGIDTLFHELRDVSKLREQLLLLRSDPDVLSSLHAESDKLAPAITWEAAAASLFSAYNKGCRADRRATAEEQA